MPPISGEEILKKIKALLAKIEAKIEAIKNKINSILSHVPGFLHWVVSKIEDAWNKLVAKLGEFWDWFTDKLAYVGDPLLLWNTGDAWLSKVGDPGKQIADSIDDDSELLADNEWTGTGASAYKSAVPGQESTLRSLGQSFASTVSSQLKTLAGGIALFWAGIVVAIVALVVAIVIATAATGTIIGIPAAVVSIIAGVIAFLSAAGLGLAALKIACMLAKDGLNNVTRYAPPKWPSFAF